MSNGQDQIMWLTYSIVLFYFGPGLIAGIVWTVQNWNQSRLNAKNVLKMRNQKLQRHRFAQAG